MRSVATKILLFIGISTILFSGFLLYQSYALTNRRIREVVEQQASMALKFDLAIRNYIGQNVRPLMYKIVDDEKFLPETMSTSYVARSIFEEVRNDFPDYIIKFSSDNPRNPANQAGPAELKIIKYLNGNPQLDKWSGKVEINGKQYMAKFSARRMKASCLHCHGDPKDAPKSLIERYGSTAGFYRPFGEIIGLDTIAIPMSKIDGKLWSESFRTFVISILGLLVFFLAIALVIRFFITNRLSLIAQYFLKASQNNNYAEIEPIDIKGNDEISDLALSFNTLSGKLRNFYSSLEKKVEERTLEIEQTNEKLRMEIAERKRVEETLLKGEARLRRQNETLMALANHKTVYSGDLIGAMKQIMKASARTLEVERASVWLYNTDRTKICCQELYELSSKRHSNGLELVASEYPDYFKALETERTIPASDAHSDPRTKEFSESYLNPLGITSMLDAPIWVGGKMVGVVCFEHIGKQREWKIDEQNFAGSVSDFVSLALEISEHKQSENTRKQLEIRLQRAEKMEAIGTLAGGVAHDLNNVLSGIVSYPDLLLMELPEDSTLRQPIETMRESGKKATAIVQDLLTLARRGVAITEVVNINATVSDYLASAEHKRLRHYHAGVEIETSLAPQLLNVLGSPVHLSKTVMNLISNAAEAMPDGGKIFISTENKYIDQPIVGYDDVQEGDYILLTISDTGIGISSEDIGRIFEPFYTKKVMGRSGTGLGMAVVWGTVKDHNGYIDVQSIRGEGSTFKLYFPVTRKEIAEDNAPFSIECYRGNGETILVVDDIKEQRDISYTILSQLGYSVTTVSSGEEALDYVKHHNIDLMVLDMIMDPGIDGLETYKRISKINPGQRAIITSGFSENNRVRKVQQLGAGHYIKKPYTIEKIGLAVKNELGKEQQI